MIADSAVCVQDYGVARHPIPVAIPKVGAPTVHPPKQEVARHNIPLIEQETPAAETVQETLEDLIAYCKNVVTVTTAGAARSLLRSVRMRLEGASSEALYSNDIENGLLDQFSQRISDPKLLLPIVRRAENHFARSYWPLERKPLKFPEPMPDDAAESDKRRAERRRKIDEMRPWDHPVLRKNKR